MSHWLPMLAQSLTPQVSKASKFVMSDVFLITAGAVLVFVIFFGWIVLVRGSKSSLPGTRSTRSSHSHSSSEPRSDGAHRVRKKRRERRREHRGRNPTLAEVGGLPDPTPPEARPST